MMLASPWARRNGCSGAPALGRLDFLLREPAEVYHAKSKEYLTSHALADFRENPLLYRKRQLGLVVEEDRPAFQIGRAAHTLILEGRDAYRRQYAFGGPTNPATGKLFDSRSKAYQEWAERQAKPVLTDRQAALVEELAGAVQRHPVAGELLAEGLPESVLRCDYRGVPCQARLDWLNPAKGLVDLKTCDHLKYLEADARSFGYLHQLAFYRALLALAGGEQVPVYLIAVEKREPFRCGVWRIDPNVLAACERDNEAALERLVRCRQLDHWPTGYEELRVFDHI
ncbi:hypothetical protein Isop_2439 [Isosphaera pallida ATCC 43644]|uniref:Putative exodeoxyribonuclease 8 PDDEXK-like domain-containing protein n=1 Tax=Isosphaera pallida (strain ATCC 43644 / DSM 9630 / IS1B) TaxID=575540 RepID=E8QXG5_ISOPI|nr:PD-(D/E)XK nuclease-like domain-containing protein [Isosphaera pallida]ADV63013.1 hypothetical protein Isop_2439 [Isosphaera pallida ATCC 43644]